MNFNYLCTSVPVQLFATYRARTCSCEQLVKKYGSKEWLFDQLVDQRYGFMSQMDSITHPELGGGVSFTTRKLAANRKLVAANKAILVKPEYFGDLVNDDQFRQLLNSPQFHERGYCFNKLFKFSETMQCLETVCDGDQLKYLVKSYDNKKIEMCNRLLCDPSLKTFVHADVIENDNKPKHSALAVVMNYSNKYSDIASCYEVNKFGICHDYVSGAAGYFVTEPEAIGGHCASDYLMMLLERVVRHAKYGSLVGLCDIHMLRQPKVHQGVETLVSVVGEKVQEKREVRVKGRVCRAPVRFRV